MRPQASSAGGAQGALALGGRWETLLFQSQSLNSATDAAVRWPFLQPEHLLAASLCAAKTASLQNRVG